MTLSDFVEQYISGRDISDGYADQLRWIVVAFDRTHGRHVALEDLTADLVNVHLKSNRDTHSPETRKSQRRMLLTLWQGAADAGLTSDPPRRRIMRIRVPERLHRAWTFEQVQSLLTAADRLLGYYSHGIKRRLYWRAYVLAAWDSGLRGCDLRLFTREAIGWDGRCLLVQHKTGKVLRVFLRPETIAAIAGTFPPERETIWPLWGRLETWRREAKRLIAAAEIHGSIGQLRHSSGTAVEIEFPGHGHEHLGNTRQVFERHYLDQSQIDTAMLLPRPLV